MHKVDFFRANSRFEIGWVFPWLISASILISISILTPWLSGCLHPPAFHPPCQLLDANRNLTAKSPLAWPHARIATTLEKTVFAMHGGARRGRERKFITSTSHPPSLAVWTLKVLQRAWVRPRRCLIIGRSRETLRNFDFDITSDDDSA